MLEVIANNRIAVGADNVDMYGDYAGGHYLLTLAFYEAIAGRSWCWFYHHAYDLLKDYYGWTYWRNRDPLPEIEHRHYMNCEIFGLGLGKRTTTLNSVADESALYTSAQARGLSADAATNAMDLTGTWYCYGGRWSPWDAMAVSGVWPMPLTGPVRSQYDYAGADAVTRIEAPIIRLTPGPGGTTDTNTLTWTAAAKPFGYLEGDRRPNDFDIVLPAFREVRLIPLDGSSSDAGGGYNLAWRRHIDEHLKPYVQTGRTVPGCFYCMQLETWEERSFRQAGIDWLKVNYWKCITHGGGGGGGRGGGSRRGH
jgi:hypothetical protein